MKSIENETYVNPHYFSDEELENIYSPIHYPDSKEFTKKNVVIINNTI